MRRAAAVVGAGVNGQAVARTFLARGRKVAIHDVDRARAEAAAGEGSAPTSPIARRRARGGRRRHGHAGQERAFRRGFARPGQHVSLMGADGPDKGEIAPSSSLAPTSSATTAGQASHAGDVAHAVDAGLVARERGDGDGRVLAGEDRAAAPPTR